MTQELRSQHASKAATRSSASDYWRSRADLLYYQYVYFILRAAAPDARSLIDVGTRNCGYLEWFDWIDTIVSVDLVKPYQSERVTGCKADFFDYAPSQRFDVALCSQVLEHVPEAGAFAAKLFAIADKVLITVPYKWSARRRTPGHVHDPVDEEKLARWTGRKATYAVVVEEPFRPKSPRLIAYYDAIEPDRVPDRDAIAARRPTRFL